MHAKYTPLTPELYAWVREHGVRPDPLVERLQQATAELGDVARMQIAPDQGAFLTLLVRACGARHAIEVGTFTGMSAIAIARGLPPSGRLVCFEIDEHWAMFARRWIEEAGLEERVEVRIGPAREGLDALPESWPIDFAFVDADKESYPAYWDELVGRLRPGGMLAFDNAFWGGSVADPTVESTSTEAIREVTRRAADDDRVDVALVPVADGLLLAVKR